MDALCTDLKRSIVGFLDPLSVGSLEQVTREWQVVSNESRVYYRGSLNSTIFTYQGLLYHGPAFMPFVTELDLSTDVFVSVDSELLSEGLKALKLPQILANTFKNLTVKVNQYSWHICRTFLLDLCALAKFKSIEFHGCFACDCNDASARPLLTEALTCGSEVYSTLNVKTTELRLCDDIYSTALSRNYYEIEVNALVKAFSSEIDALSLSGPCMHDSIVPKLQKSCLKKLELVSQSNRITWCNARLLQLKTPYLESFTLRASNIIFSDVEEFEWTLWPHLTAVDLSLNYTLYVPAGKLFCLPTVSKLRLHGTRVTCADLWASETFPQELSICADTTTQVSEYLQRCPLNKLNLSVTHFLQGHYYDTRTDLDKEFWRKLCGISDIEVKLCDFFYHDHIIQSLQKQCAHIKKCVFTDFQ